MNFPDRLRVVWEARAVKDPTFWPKNYEAAVDRIQDHTASEINPYWHSPADCSDAVPGGDHLVDEFGGEEPARKARERAFELLVLADLIDSHAAERAA